MPFTIAEIKKFLEDPHVEDADCRCVPCVTANCCLGASQEDDKKYAWKKIRGYINGANDPLKQIIQQLLEEREAYKEYAHRIAGVLDPEIDVEGGVKLLMEEGE